MSFGSVTFRHRIEVWKFPEDRFVEYSSNDEKWARTLGFGKEVSVC